MAQDIQAKIGSLLRLAEKASTPEESDAYQAKAQELSTRYAIDMEIARTLKDASERRPELVKEGFRIGDPGKRGMHPFFDLLQAIASENNVQLTLLQDATYSWLHGYDNDVDTTKALYTSLVTQMVHESDAYIRSGQYKTETTYREVRVKTSWGGSYTDWKEAPVHGKTARRSFQQAFTYKVAARLRDARRHAEQEAAAGHFHADSDTPLEILQATNSESVAVAIREKTKAVSNFLRQENPRLRTFRSSSKSSAHSSHAASAGREAGARARLSAPRALSAASN